MVKNFAFWAGLMSDDEKKAIFKKFFFGLWTGLKSAKKTKNCLTYYIILLNKKKFLKIGYFWPLDWSKKAKYLSILF